MKARQLLLLALLLWIIKILFPALTLEDAPLAAENQTPVDKPQQHESSMLNPTTYQQDQNQSDLPTSVDWRQRLILSDPQEQGLCQSSWAFAMASISEVYLTKKYGSLFELSAEYLLECSQAPTCAMDNRIVQGAETLRSRRGLPLSESYPYKAILDNDTTPTTNGICKNSFILIVTDLIQTKPIETLEQMKKEIDNAPIAASIFEEQQFINFKGGKVYQCSQESSSKPERDHNHVVTLIGYTSEGDYIIKNSRGPDWGEKGYARVSSKPGKNCGIGQQIILLQETYLHLSLLVLVLISIFISV